MAIRALRLIPSWPSNIPEYLVKQLQEFKSDKRANPIMKGFASALSDEDMKNIAYWVASKKAKPGFRQGQGIGDFG